MARHTGENEQALRTNSGHDQADRHCIVDDPDYKIDQKAFHGEILKDHDTLKKEQDAYKDIPPIRKLDNTMVQQNYLQIKQDVQNIIQSEMERMLNDPGLNHLVVTKIN